MTPTDEEVDARYHLQRAKGNIKQAFSVLALDPAPGEPLAKCLLGLMDRVDEAMRLLAERAEARKS